MWSVATNLKIVALSKKPPKKRFNTNLDYRSNVTDDFQEDTK